MRPISRLQNQSVGERALMRDQNPCNNYTNQPTDDDCMYLIPYIGCF